MSYELKKIAMENTIKFDWTKFIVGLLSALMGALTASAAVNITI